VYALGFFGGESAVEIERKAVQNDESRFVRYNAAVALARRGDPVAKSTLREMLSTADLNKGVDLKSPTEKQNKIESIELEALGALKASVVAGKSEMARSLLPEIEDLTKSGLVSVRTLAQELLQSLQNKP
jgi:HEAT repeat protein